MATLRWSKQVDHNDILRVAPIVNGRPLGERFSEGAVPRVVGLPLGWGGSERSFAVLADDAPPLRRRYRRHARMLVRDDGLPGKPSYPKAGPMRHAGHGTGHGRQP